MRPVDGGGFEFARELYIDARNVPEVLAGFGVPEGGSIVDLIETCEIPVQLPVCP